MELLTHRAEITLRQEICLPTQFILSSCMFPAHDTGLVMLQVAMGGEVISSSVVFEYKARDLPALPSSQHDWLSLDGEHIHASLST